MKEETTDARISVIVPVYNVARYLEECLESIASQTFLEFEVICVDDGSDDGSGGMLDNYASLDRRFRVIHKDNTGYGASMNIGMDAARGEYVGIVESDDRIKPDFLETLYKAAKEDDLDIVKSEFLAWYPTQAYEYHNHASWLEKYHGKILQPEKLWLRCQFPMNTWNGLYKKSFLSRNGIRHHESPGASYQDNGFWMQGMIFAEKVMFLDYAGYMYRQDNEAASIKDGRKIYCMSDEYEWLSCTLAGRISGRQMDVLNAFRLIRSYRNTSRIDDIFKREFCDRLLDDYEKYGDAFFMDLGWQELFDEVRDDPDSFCRNMIARRAEVTRRIEAADNIIIYGAGKRGERIYRTLCYYGWISKLGCFVETRKPVNRMVGKTPVYQIDASEVMSRDSLVIVSAAPMTRMADEMNRNLSERNIRNVMDSNDVVLNFYLIC